MMSRRFFKFCLRRWAWEREEGRFLAVFAGGREEFRQESLDEFDRVACFAVDVEQGGETSANFFRGRGDGIIQIDADSDDDAVRRRRLDEDSGDFFSDDQNVVRMFHPNGKRGLSASGIGRIRFTGFFFRFFGRLDFLCLS